MGRDVQQGMVTFKVSPDWTTYARTCPTAAGFRRHKSAGGQAVCLALRRGALSYLDSDHQCQALGARLVRVKTLDALLLLRGILQEENIGDKWIWVGADDLQNPFDFRWNDGSALPRSDALWDGAEEGYDLANERCVSLKPGGKLCDNLCRIQRQVFFCQFDI